MDVMDPARHEAQLRQLEDTRRRGDRWAAYNGAKGLVAELEALLRTDGLSAQTSHERIERLIMGHDPIEPSDRAYYGTAGSLNVSGNGSYAGPSRAG